MLKIILLSFTISTFLFCCSSSKKVTLNTTTNFPASTPKEADDGLSYATAIVIMEKTEREGIDAEYAWIKQHYSDYTIKMQSLSYNEKKPYDIITIHQSNGKDLPLYFDISNYFGKY